MVLDALLARGRAAAEALMTDECVIRRDGGTTYDPETGYPTESTSQVYAGKCRVQQQSASAGAREVGEAAVLLLRLEVQVPMSVVGVQADDVVEVTASRHDVELVGRRFRVRDLFHKTHATSRRLGVEEVTS
ncbi:DUF6093 family protein [Micromonospora tulbaghiae]|uniref:DUF6093 family protein n=1 Tax=Micromonospora tulbaghiae TaxID=479978 RepID=UPI00341E33CB